MAFSGLGSGTVGDPYQVATAAQLAEIDDSAENLASHYIQTADITIPEEGDAWLIDYFSGSYNGQGYWHDSPWPNPLFGTTTGTVRRCHAKGATVGDIGGGSGLVRTLLATGRIYDCISERNVNDRYPAGLVVEGNYSPVGLGEIHTSLCVGDINVSSGLSVPAGILFDNYGLSGHVINCYFDKDVAAGCFDEATSGLFTAQLQSGDLPTGFDPEIWIAEAGQYPKLRTPDMAIVVNNPTEATAADMGNQRLMFNATGTADTADDFVPAVASKSIILIDLIISSAATQSITIRDGDTTAVLGPYSMIAGVPFVVPLNRNENNPTDLSGCPKLTAGNAAYVYSSSTGVVTLTGHALYV